MKNVIYKIRNVVNQKFYVGSTVNTRERFRNHRKLLRRGAHHCRHLQAAWNKYGEDCFKFEIVEHVDTAEALHVAEDRWLHEWVGHVDCYNHGRSAAAPWRNCASEEHPNFGRPRSEEARQAISESLKAFYAEDPSNHPRLGKQHTEETKERIRQIKLANPTRAWLGKKRSAETKAKISEAQRGVAKAPRVYTAEGLARAQENMRRNAREQKPADFSSVLAKFPDEVRNKYDFSQAIYTGALVRIEKCICPIHGEFSQYAAQFRKGRGCPSCGQDQRSATRSAQMKQAWANPEEREKMMEARQKKLDTPKNV